MTLTADAFVNKGPGRPVFAEFQRAEMLAALAYVDHVAINNGPDAEQVIRALQPDFYVKGSDYANADQDVTGKIAVERAAVEAGGGKLVFTDDITFSTSELISRHLDVFDTEPLPVSHPFWTLDNVVVTPHISGPSVPVEITPIFGDNLRRHLSGRPLRFQVDPRRGY